MRKTLALLAVLALATTAFAGFKPKLIKAKKAEQFETRATTAGATYAADLLLEAKDQKEYFYKDLTPSSVIALRLAVPLPVAVLTGFSHRRTITGIPWETATGRTSSP